MTRILIAIDGTDLDLKIADTVRRLFPDEADVWAVNVQDSAVPPGGEQPKIVPVAYGGAYPYLFSDPYLRRNDRQSTAESAEEARRRAEATAHQSGLDDAHIVAEIGDPAEAILRAANEHHADLIVVGTHDRGWWSRLVRPSVSSRLTENAHRPVLLVTESA